MRHRVTRLLRGHSLDLVIPGSVLVLILFTLLSPAILPTPSPTGGRILDANLPAFSPSHLLGTDMNGNDVWSRLVHGGRISILVALAVNLLGMVLGGALGTCSALFGRTVDMLIMRTLDALLAFPTLILLLALAQIVEPTLVSMVGALSFFAIPAFARIARAATLRTRELPFIAAARLCGTRSFRVLYGHIAPNIAPQLLTFALLGMGSTIIIEGALGFLGFGVQPPNPSWGNMIQQGQMTLSATPALVLYPGAALFLTVISFNMLGEALRVRWERP